MPDELNAANVVWLTMLGVVSFALILSRDAGQSQLTHQGLVAQASGVNVHRDVKKNAQPISDHLQFSLLPIPTFTSPLNARVSTALGKEACDMLSTIDSLLLDMSAVGKDAARPHGYRGDRSRIKAGFARAATADGHLRVVVIGGSMPYGVELKRRKIEAWPARLESLLALIWHGQVSMINLAVGGVPSNPQVPMISKYHSKEIGRAHLVIVDITINDRPNHPSLSTNANATGLDWDTDGGCLKVEGCELMDALPLMCHARAGIVYLETLQTQGRYSTIQTADSYVQFRNAGFPNHAMDGELYPTVSWNSGLTLRALDGEHGAHFWESSNFHPEGWKLGVAGGWHWPRLLQRKLPVISYGDGAVKAALLSNASDPNLLWSNFPHPDARTHMLCALVVLHGLVDMLSQDSAISPLEDTWNRQLLRADDATIPAPSLTAQCHVNMVTEMGAHVSETTKGAPKFGDAEHGAGWKYYADVRGKLGWIFGGGQEGVATPGSTFAAPIIGFNVTLGPRRQVIVSNLRTYGKGLGSALCSVGCRPAETACPTILVETRWDQKVSQEFVTNLVIPDDSRYTGVGWRNGDSSTVWCAANGDGKVKLLTIGTC